MFVQSSFPFISQKHFPKLGMIIGKEPLQENPAFKISIYDAGGALPHQAAGRFDWETPWRYPLGKRGRLENPRNAGVACWKIIELNDGFSIAWLPGLSIYERGIFQDLVSSMGESWNQMLDCPLPFFWGGRGWNALFTHINSRMFMGEFWSQHGSN